MLVVAGSVYLQLLVMRMLGLGVFAAAESGGWSAPSLLGWIVVGVFWAVVWWRVALFESFLATGLIKKV